MTAIGSCCLGALALAFAVSTARAGDGEFAPLWRYLASADAVVLGETIAPGPDPTHVSLRVLASSAEIGSVLTIPHPRLATPQGFVTFVAGDRYVYLLYFDAEGLLRPLERGETATFPVDGVDVLIPALFEPGIALPAIGPAIRVPIDRLFAVAETCAEPSASLECQSATEAMLAEGQTGQAADPPDDPAPVP